MEVDEKLQDAQFPIAHSPSPSLSIEVVKQESVEPNAAAFLSAPYRKSSKRKGPDGQALQHIIYNDSSTSAAALVLQTTPLTSPLTSKRLYSTRNLVNKLGFRYLPCGPSPNFAPLHPTYRAIESPPNDVVRFSWEDRSPYTTVSDDALTISTDKGFRGARANVPLREGTWYFEFLIEKGGGEAVIGSSSNGAHVRIGIGRREAGLNAPVGIDGFSYGLRDKTGEKITLSQTRAFGPAFGTGDVIGILIHLPPRQQNLPALLKSGEPDPHHPANIVRKRIAIRVKGQLYFESLEYIPAKEMTDVADAITDAMIPKAKNARQKAAAPGTKYRPPPAELLLKARPIARLDGSAVWFFKNGEVMDSQPAFENLYDWLPMAKIVRKDAQSKRKMAAAVEMMQNRENYNDDGTLGYYPFASVYGGGMVTLNPGPEWRCPPSASPDVQRVGECSAWRPLSERHAEYMAEQHRIDELEEADVARRAAEAAANLPVEDLRLSKSMKRSTSSSASAIAYMPSPLHNLSNLSREPSIATREASIASALDVPADVEMAT